MPGDYQLVKTVVIAEMAVLHLEAYDRSKSLPRLIDWGIQIQATIGMVSNVTISDMIIESSTALRIIGTVSDVTITRVQFLMLGPASEDVIKLDRLKLGGDGTNSDDEVHGIKFVDCIFDTRNSVVSAGTNFFSWRQLIGYGSGGVDDWSPNNRLVFDTVTMLGHERGPLQLLLDSAPFVSLVRSSLYHTAFTADDAIDYDISDNRIDGSGILMTGNVTNTTLARNTFQNIGSTILFPTLIRPTCLTFLPSFTGPALYENVAVTDNTFVNITGTNDDPSVGYSAVLFVNSIQRIDYNNVYVAYNDFSQLTVAPVAPPTSEGTPSSSPSKAPSTAPSTSHPQSAPQSSPTHSSPQSSEDPSHPTSPTSHPAESSSPVVAPTLHPTAISPQQSQPQTQQPQTQSPKSSGGGFLDALSSVTIRSTFIRPRRTGAWAILSSSNKVDASYNYYGDPKGPSSCCNPDASHSTAQLTPYLIWYPWCTNRNCSEVATVPTPDCYECSPLLPLTPVKDDGSNATMVIILVTATLALIVLIMGLTGLYCFTRAKHPEEYALLPTDGWRSRLLASVRREHKRKTEALFSQQELFFVFCFCHLSNFPFFSRWIRVANPPLTH